MILNWHTSKEDAEAIAKIVKRAHEMAKDQGIKLSGLETTMDITACHNNGCPLKLAELADASPLDFTHDIFGIIRHINRETGKLENCFLPRYAA